MGDHRETTVVVGVDTSPAARAAARWAARAALRLGADLVVIHAPEPPGPASFPAVPKAEALDRAFPDELTEELEAADEVNVHLELSSGEPVEALVAASTSAELLVLGRPRRRVGSWPNQGSITRKVLDRSACPVVLVREGHDPMPPGA